MKRENVSELRPRPLVVAISSRALFDLARAHKVFEQEGLKSYAHYQRRREEDVLAPGMAFPLVKKLLRLQRADGSQPAVEVILASRNSADSGLRIFNSIEHHGLQVERAVFTNGEPPHRYMEALGADLFLSTHDEDVRQALAAGFAAARILPGCPRASGSIRFARFFSRRFGKLLTRPTWPNGCLLTACRCGCSFSCTSYCGAIYPVNERHDCAKQGTKSRYFTVRWAGLCHRAGHGPSAGLFALSPGG